MSSTTLPTPPSAGAFEKSQLRPRVPARGSDEDDREHDQDRTSEKPFDVDEVSYPDGGREAWSCVAASFVVYAIAPPPPPARLLLPPPPLRLRRRLALLTLQPPSAHRLLLLAIQDQHRHLADAARPLLPLGHLSIPALAHSDHRFLPRSRTRISAATTSWKWETHSQGIGALRRRGDGSAATAATAYSKTGSTTAGLLQRSPEDRAGSSSSHITQH
ncbi:hypothetical protein V8E36_008363 [Tilletia maclaganii]